MDTIDLSLLILQLGIGLTFAAHGAQKVFGWWGGPGLAGWEGAMAHMGFRPAKLFALASALTELVGGLLLAVGLLTPLAAAALAVGFGAVTAVLWEFAEYWTFIRDSPELETAYEDTLGDLALGLSGSTVAALATAWLIRRRDPGRRPPPRERRSV